MVQSRLFYIDTLKGLAILGVFLLHFDMTFPCPTNLISKISAIGARAPQLFFIISAYLTWKSIDKPSLSWKQFFKTRFYRLAPLYYLSLLAAILLPTYRVNLYSIWDYLAHILFLNGLNPVWIHDMMGVEWYIADLAIFYMIAPLLKKLIYNFKSGLCYFLLATCVSSLILIIYNHLFGPQISNSQYFYTFFFPHQLPAILLGILLYYITKKREYIPPKWLFILGISCFLIIGNFIYFKLNKRYITSSWVASIFWTFLFLICYQLRDYFNQNTFLSKLGKYSLSVYLFHWTIIKCIAYFLSTPNILNWIILFLTTLLISYWFGKFLENQE